MLGADGKLFLTHRTRISPSSGRSIMWQSLMIDPWETPLPWQLTIIFQFVDLVWRMCTILFLLICYLHMLVVGGGTPQARRHCVSSLDNNDITQVPGASQITIASTGPKLCHHHLIHVSVICESIMRVSTRMMHIFKMLCFCFKWTIKPIPIVTYQLPGTRCDAR